MKERRIGRREFLKLAGVAIAGAALSPILSGCKPTERHEPTKEDPNIIALRESINELPPSIIKTLLVQRVLPYYQLHPPEKVTYSGISFKVTPATVIEEITTMPRVLAVGEFTPRRKSAPLQPLYPLKDTDMKFPILNLLTSVELQNIPPQHKASDGTPLVFISYLSSVPLFEGIAPQITIKTADPANLSDKERVLIPDAKRLVRIKEACGLLLFDILLEKTVRKIQQLGLPTHIDVRRPDNSTTQAEIVNQSLQTLHQNHGRSMAAYDIAAYLLALKAVQGTKLFTAATQDPLISKIIPEVDSINLGNRVDSVFSTSLAWAISSSSAKNLHHQGDLQKFP